MFETLEIVTDNGAATVWMNRPEVHNAFKAQLIADLHAACTALDAIGERQAGRYYLTAERLDAERAVQLGLAHEAVPADGLDTVIAAIIQALKRGGPRAQTAAKALIRGIGTRAVPDAVVDDTARRIAALRATPEAKEGLGAFLAKRPAAWTLD